MQVGGFVPFSTSDFPGHLSAVVFCQGCPWRCHYCHNPHLQPFAPRHTVAVVTWNEVMSQLKKRVGLLDAVVFSGGEPTMQSDILESIQAVRRLGFKIGLHTAGANPQVFKSLLSSVDWVGLDIKAIPARYATVTQVSASGAAAEACLNALKETRVSCEIRTTFHPDLLDEDDLLSIASLVKAAEVSDFTIQRFRKMGSDNISLGEPSIELSARTISTIRAMFDRFVLR